MKKGSRFDLRYCPRAENTTKETGHANSDVVFLFVRGLLYLQGVLHSSSLPDYIEDKKSGGQKTDRLKNVCALIQLSSQDLQNLKWFNRMLKTVT